MQGDAEEYYIGVDLGGSRTKIGLSGRSGDLIFGSLEQEVGERAFPIAVDGARIVPAALGNDAGMIGAVGLIRKKVEGSVVP